jgi:hypothetical protein
MALAGCLVMRLAMGSLSSAAGAEKKNAGLTFSGVLYEADRKYGENQGEINLTVRAGPDIAGLSTLP